MSPLPRAIPFVGRRGEIARIAAYLEEGARLVTLVGPGGIGKTALAAEHGADVFCSLAAATSEAAIVDAMAAALGTSQVAAALAARGEVVAILDNFDGLTEHALATVGAWLDAAPELRIIVTSRERLALASEVVIEVGPLDDAVALLTASASKSGTPYLLRPEDAAAARALAELLEGMPLALEMAGAQLPLFGVPALLERIRTGTATLARDVRGGPARHASLEAAVAGSFSALPPEAQHLLAECTVFRGGFTAIAVSEMFGAAAVTTLQLLHARSLVRTSDAAAARFDLYQAVRSFAANALPAPVARAAATHTAYFTARAEGASPAWLAAEQANVMAVVHRALDSAAMSAAAAEPALRALVALSPVLLQREMLAQVAALITPVIERTRDSGADPRLTARVMLLRGALRRERGDVRGALKDLLGAETMARALGDALLAADLRVELGRTLLMAGELAPAKEHFARAQEAFAQLGARDREAHALAWLGFAIATHDVAAARVLLERASVLPNGEHYRLLVGRASADLGDRMGAKTALHAAPQRAHALVLLGLVAHDEGDLARAAHRHGADSLELEGLAAEAAEARGLLGLVAKEQGRDAESYALLADARDMLVRHGEDASLFEGILGLPVTASRRAPSLLRGWPRGPLSIHARVARRAGGGAPAPLAADALVIGARGGWFVPPGGARVGLERRASLAMLLDRLVDERIARPGQALAGAELFRAAWPGEKAQANAAAHRVRVAVATLRKLGLRDALITLEGGVGYALSADVPVMKA